MVSALGGDWTRWPQRLSPTEASQFQVKGCLCLYPFQEPLPQIASWNVTGALVRHRPTPAPGPLPAVQGLQLLLEGSTPTGQAVQVQTDLGQATARRGGGGQPPKGPWSLSLDPPYRAPPYLTNSHGSPEEQVRKHTWGGLSSGPSRRFSALLPAGRCWERQARGWGLAGHETRGHWGR